MEGAKQKILEVATKLFAEKGYARVSIRELTVAANANVAAISYYFGGKEGLYQEVIKAQLGYVNNMLTSLQEKKGLSIVEKLKLYMKMHIELKDKLPLLGKFMNSEMSNPTPFVGPIILDHISQTNDMIYALVEEGIKKGEFRVDADPVYCTIMVAAIVNFYFFANPFERELKSLDSYDQDGCEIDSKTYMEKTFDIYLNGVCKR